MSLLDPIQSTPPTAATQQLKNAQVKASIIINGPLSALTSLSQVLDVGTKALWSPGTGPTAPTTQQILDACQTQALARGGKASDLFTYCSQAIAFLEGLKPGSTAEIGARIGSFTVNPDGPVTVNS